MWKYIFLFGALLFLIIVWRFLENSARRERLRELFGKTGNGLGRLKGLPKRILLGLKSVMKFAALATVIILGWIIIYRFQETAPFPHYKPHVVVREGYVISFSTKTRNSPESLAFPTPGRDEYAARISSEGGLICIRWDYRWEPRNEGSYDYKGNVCLVSEGNGVFSGGFEGDMAGTYRSGKREGHMRLICSVDRDTKLPHDCFSGWAEVRGKYGAVTLKKITPGKETEMGVRIQGLYGRRAGG